MASTVREDDPFRDPHDPLLAATPQPQPHRSADCPGEHMNVPDTLAVGRNASLSLGTDSLIVLETKSTRSIAFYNILWAEHAEDGQVTIQYAQTVSKKAVRPALISYTLDKPDSQLAEAWIEKLLDRAYGTAQRRKRIKVLLNPFGGQGGAVKMYHKLIAPIFAAARCELDVAKTQHQGHGVEIARDMDIEAYDVVACCSGDGIPHEVWNGLGQRPDAARALHHVAVAQLPCGSGNALSINFNGTDSPSAAALAVVKGLRTPLDLASITQGDRRTLSFLSQAVGIVAELDLATEHLRWMGSARFTWGFLVRLINKTVYPADIAVKVEYDNKAAVREAYRTQAAKPPLSNHERTLPPPDAGLPSLKHGTINDALPSDWELIPHDHLGNFYAGNIAYMSPDMNFFPACLPSDGCLDLVRIRGDIARHTSLKSMMAIENGNFFDLEHVDYQKVSAYRIIPKRQREGYISIDGERVPFEGFQVEVHRGLGTVLSKSGHLCEAKGV
ncbi:sphingoid long chain base kinase-like protein [Decorospora gaudefroyi]|uniref:Sphingoid long chain base kinase-like protein n=1 Tax=Decorospora gaudefroyi TaxID=184978 RepID=A0A6A5KFD5_9PLEO|nr:sphingoid long chain base kinase-like protein [Decorospora gaudefroyi]